MGFKRRTGRGKEGERKVPSPPKAFLVSRVTEVHRDEDLDACLGRRTSGCPSTSEASEGMGASTSDTRGTSVA
jgi:hypothetical protein